MVVLPCFLRARLSSSVLEMVSSPFNTDCNSKSVSLSLLLVNALVANGSISTIKTHTLTYSSRTVSRNSNTEMDVYAIVLLY